MEPFCRSPKAEAHARTRSSIFAAQWGKGARFRVTRSTLPSPELLELSDSFVYLVAQ
jgi:hypothetical protein